MDILQILLLWPLFNLKVFAEDHFERCLIFYLYEQKNQILNENFISLRANENVVVKLFQVN